MLARQGVLVVLASGFGLLLLFPSPVDARRIQSSDPEVSGPEARAVSLEAAAAADTARERETGVEPAIAGGMSALLIPGAGQFYNGQNMKGVLMLTGVAASLIYAVTAGIGEKEFCTGSDVEFSSGSNTTSVCSTHPSWPNSRFWLGLGSAAGIQAWSILDAIAVATRRERAAQGDARLELVPRQRGGELGFAVGVRLTR